MANACRPTRQQIFHHRISRLALELARANSMIKIWKWRVKSHRTPRELLLSTDSGRMFVVSPSALIFAFGSSRKCLNATHKKPPQRGKVTRHLFFHWGWNFVRMVLTDVDPRPLALHIQSFSRTIFHSVFAIFLWKSFNEINFQFV